MINKCDNKGWLWTQSLVSSVVSREQWALLGDDPKQKFPIGALWPSQHYRTDRSLQGPCRLSSCMASFQHREGGRWGLCFIHLYIRVSFQRKCSSTGTEDIKYHFSLYLVGKSCGGKRRVSFLLYGCRYWDQGCKGHNETPSWYCREASCSPGPLSPSVR